MQKSEYKITTIKEWVIIAIEMADKYTPSKTFDVRTTKALFKIMEDNLTNYMIIYN